MEKHLDIYFDQAELDSVAAEFDLRAPNKKALRALILALTDDDFDRHTPQVLNLATGVGKTYLMAAFMEYLRRQGVGHVMIVTPSLTVQSKTIQNFTAGHKRYIKGAPVPPEVVTPQDYSAWRTRLNIPAATSVGGNDPMLAFVFNIQQLIAPKDPDALTKGNTAKAAATRIRRFDETSGVLFEYLQSLSDLVIIADESHLYGSSAKAFSAALKELDPAATVGLTASSKPGDHVIFKYPLYQAISDRFVKTPVLAFRKTGYGEDEASEEQQLRDALSLLKYKQQAYDQYCQEHKREHLNAVLFVVCSDVAHATQIAELLRSSEYFNNQLAVLQVDNEHNNPQTLQLLDNLDAKDSPVRAVVSVNKLKEGWDVKNIAVVVTLRAMASEVLTQQTMGRGLRLPFGQYTDNFHIDQLDIISHHSFKELLASEDVLMQFGLDEAVSETQQDAVREQIQATIARAEQSESPSVAITPDNENPIYPTSSNSQTQSPEANILATANPLLTPYTPVSGSTVKFTAFDSLFDTEHGVQPLPSNQEIVRTKGLENIQVNFPKTFMEPVEEVFALHKIPATDIESAARRVSSSGDVLLRKEIRQSKRRRLLPVDTESAVVDSLPISEDKVKEELIRYVMSLRVVPTTPASERSAERSLVPTFMANVVIDHWTLKTYESAERELGDLIRSYADSLTRSRTSQIVIKPIALPSMETRYLPLGVQVQERIDATCDFQRGAYYGDWMKCLYTAESFDSFSGEYELARLLDTSSDIKWWLRLHISMGASIQYNLKQDYYPDFLAQDKNGTIWIIEGKDARGREDDTVQAKRKAAESMVQYLVIMDEYLGQSWGYLIAYEDDVKTSDTWSELKAKAHPVSN